MLFWQDWFNSQVDVVCAGFQRNNRMKLSFCEFLVQSKSAGSLLIHAGPVRDNPLENDLFLNGCAAIRMYIKTSPTVANTCEILCFSAMVCCRHLMPTSAWEIEQSYRKLSIVYCFWQDWVSFQAAVDIR